MFRAFARAIRPQARGSRRCGCLAGCAGDVHIP